MKRFIEGQNRNQVTLLPECLDDYIAEDNPVLDAECDCTCLFGQEACLTDPACDPRLHSRCIAGHANGSC